MVNVEVTKRWNMVKKILPIVCCVLAICAVLGLNDRLDYANINIAADSIVGSAKQINTDFAYLDAIGFILTNYDPSAHLTIGVIDTGEAGINDGANLYIGIQKYDESKPTGTGEYKFKNFFFVDENDAVRCSNILRPMTWGNNQLDSPFASILDVVTTIAYVVGILISIVLLLLVIVFDTFNIAWQIVVAALYLVGVTSSL